VLSGPISPRQEVFRPGEKVFSPKRGYGRPCENDPCSMDQFGSSERIFAQARGILTQARNYSQDKS